MRNFFLEFYNYFWTCYVLCYCIKARVSKAQVKMKILVVKNSKNLSWWQIQQILTPQKRNERQSNSFGVIVISFVLIEFYSCQHQNYSELMALMPWCNNIIHNTFGNSCRIFRWIDVHACWPEPADRPQRLPYEKNTLSKHY